MSCPEPDLAGSDRSPGPRRGIIRVRERSTASSGFVYDARSCDSKTCHENQNSLQKWSASLQGLDYLQTPTS